MQKHGSSGQATVKIRRGLLEAIDRFLLTPTARRLGLQSKSDVINAAVREFLHKHKAT